MTMDNARPELNAGMTRAQFATRAAAALATTAGLGAYVQSGAAGAATSALRSRSAAPGGTLNLYTWPDYYTPKNLADFKKSTGITIHTSALDSNDTLFAKLNSPAGADYDLVIPSQYWVGIEAQKGLLLKIDKSRVPMQYIDKALLAKLPAPVNDYAIPKDYGTVGVVWDPTAVGGQIKSWQDYLDAGAKPGVSGKVELSDVPDETLGIALWAAGKSSNTTNKDDLKKAAEVMTAFAKHVKAFNEFDTAGLANGSVVMAIVDQGIARVAMRQNKKLKFVIPQPQSKLWVDEYAIPAHAHNVDQAYAFINFMLQPDRQLADAAYLGLPTAVPGLATKLPASVPLRNVIFIKPADLDRLVAYTVHPEIQELRRAALQSDKGRGRASARSSVCRSSRRTTARGRRESRRPRASLGDLAAFLPLAWLAIIFVGPLVITVMYAFAHSFFGGERLGFTFTNFHQAFSGFYLDDLRPDDRVRAFGHGALRHRRDAARLLSRTQGHALPVAASRPAAHPVLDELPDPHARVAHPARCRWPRGRTSSTSPICTTAFSTSSTRRRPCASASCTPTCRSWRYRSSSRSSASPRRRSSRAGTSEREGSARSSSSRFLRPGPVSPPECS